MSKTVKDSKNSVKNSFVKFVYSFDVPKVERRQYPDGYEPQSFEYAQEVTEFETEAKRLGELTKAMVGDARTAVGLWAESQCEDENAVIKGSDENGVRVSFPLRQALKNTAMNLITAFVKGTAWDKLFTAKNGASSKAVAGTFGNFQMDALVKALVLDKDSENEQGLVKRMFGCLNAGVEAVLAENDDKLQKVVIAFTGLTKLPSSFFAVLVQCGIYGNKGQLCRAYIEAAKLDATKARKIVAASNEDEKAATIAAAAAERAQVKREHDKAKVEASRAAEKPVKPTTIMPLHSSPLNAVNAAVTT